MSTRLSGNWLQDVIGLPIYKGEPIYTFMLATGNRTGPTEEWVWEMRPEVVLAVEELGLNN